MSGRKHQSADDVALIPFADFKKAVLPGSLSLG
jgi:hypothetical protein